MKYFFYHFPNIPCLKCTVNSNFHLIRSKTLPTNDFELTVPDLYMNKVSMNKYLYILQQDIQCAPDEKCELQATPCAPGQTPCYPQPVCVEVCSGTYLSAWRAMRCAAWH